MKKTQSYPQYHLSLILFMFFMMLIQILSTQAQTIIPEPVSWEKRRGHFNLKGSINIFIPADNHKMKSNASFLADLLKPLKDIDLTIKMYNTSDPVPSGG
ncbi:MAG: glycoside hydrolase family 20 zincin-like fold domain-containing protein, partial [Bacteroidota bacterium]